MWVGCEELVDVVVYLVDIGLGGLVVVELGLYGGFGVIDFCWVGCVEFEVEGWEGWVVDVNLEVCVVVGEDVDLCVYVVI